MYRNLLVLTAIVIMLSIVFEAGAACTAGNPNVNVIESTPTSTFTDHGNGTVTHSLTGLMWKQAVQGPMTWSTALVAAVADVTAGHSDWRVPNKKELESIVESCGYNPAINQTLFPSTPASNFWSGTTYVPYPTDAWYVSFNDGGTDAYDKTIISYLRLVRGGRSFDSFDAQGDFTPTAFSFTAQTEAALSAVTTSNTITVIGINTASPVSILGGSYAINSGAYTTTSGAVTNGDRITLQQTASGSYSTTTTATLTIGGVSGAFSVTTLAVDTTPTAFSFAAQTGTVRSSVATSNTLTVSGINSASAISIVGGTYSINGGAYISTAGTVTNGQTVTVQQAASASYSTTTTATLTIGSVSGAFNVTTLAVPVDTIPAAFSFTAQTGTALSSVATSNALTVSGINSASAISIVGGAYSINGGAYISTAGTVTNGQTVTVQQAASASYSTTTTATLTIGRVSGAFNVTTLAVPGTTSYTAPSATGSGSISASFTGGGMSCGYAISQYIPLVGHAASPPAGTAPAGVSFPHGLFDFTTSGCAAGATVTFTVTYQQALPPGTVYWKYGPTAGNISLHWYQLPAVIAGSTATFSITDGGLGDDDLAANGTIVDQGGPGVSGGAASIPTLSEWAFLTLAGLMGLFGMGAMRRRSARRM